MSTGSHCSIDEEEENEEPVLVEVERKRTSEVVSRPRRQMLVIPDGYSWKKDKDRILEMQRQKAFVPLSLSKCYPQRAHSCDSNEANCEDYDSEDALQSSSSPALLQKNTQTVSIINTDSS